MHPAAGHATGTLVNALIAHCGDSLSGIGGIRRPGIVHRLDKDTSGLLVVAKTDSAHQGLSEQFASHGTDGRLVRRYAALVWGQLDRPSGSIDAGLTRHPHDRMKFAVTQGEQGPRAVTHYSVTALLADDRGATTASLLDIRLETGRTHQIRVHMAHLGHPVVGDPVYARGFMTSARKLSPEAQQALAALGRQALHAAVLGFEHPRTRKALRFESAVPPDMASVLAALGHRPQRRRAK